MENKIILEPNHVNYKFDPRLKHGFIASGITFVVGSGATIALVPTVIGAIFSGMITIILTPLTFKVAYNMAAPKARKLVEKDVEQYLEKEKKLVVEWLGSVEAAFENDFNEFCSENDFKLNGEQNV